jgi:hypothetical protein
MRGNGEEVGAALPPDTLLLHDAQEGFMHKSGRRKGMAFPLVFHQIAGMKTKLPVHKGEELLVRLFVPCVDRNE